MQMIRHENELVQKVVLFVTIFQHLLYNNLCRLDDLKPEGIFPALGCDKIRPAFTCSVRQPTHKVISSGAEAPLALTSMSELKLRPPISDSLRQYAYPAHVIRRLSSFLE